MSPAHVDPRNVSPSLSPAYLTVLRKAAHDDGFRAELSENPAAALARCGIVTDAQLPSQVSLPEKGALKIFLNSDLPESLQQRSWMGFLGARRNAAIN